MKTALAIRHVAFEDLGSFYAVLARRGYHVLFREAGADDLSAIDPLGPDLLIALGGPIGVYEDDAYPWVRDELALLDRRLAADKPTLGICLGAQMVARALGARVHPGGNGKEIGWSPLALTAAGHNSALAHIGPDRTEVLHWHGDTFDLPAGATLLASTPRYANQAFAHGRALGLQFHPEVTARGLERWFIGHTCEIGGADGVSVAGLRAQTARQSPALEANGPVFFEAWLDQIGA